MTENENEDTTARLVNESMDRDHDRDQSWFWTEEWQEGEREASAYIAAGEMEHFDSDEEFLAALDELVKA